MKEQQNSFTSNPITPGLITKIPGVDALLRMSWQIYKSRISVLLGIMAVSVIVNLLISFFCSLLGESPSLVVSLFCFVLYFIALIVSFWSQVSLFYAIKEREQKIGIQESFQKGWHKIVSFIWVSLLVGLIGASGFLFFIIPGIIFVTWFSLALYVLIVEDLKGMDALFRSKQLVSGNWLSVFWRLSVIGLIIFAIIFLISLFLSFIEVPFKQNIISFFITPFVVIYSFLIYEALKNIKKEVSFEPLSKGTKNKYILIGLFGTFLTIGIFASIILTSFMGAKEKAKDGYVIATMGQIRSIAGMVSDNNYSGVSCVNPEIALSCDDIKKSIGEEPIIYSNQEAYCAYIELSTGYYCIDNNYGSGRTSIYPGKSGYCDGLTYVCP